MKNTINKYFEVKVRLQKTMEDGQQKKVSEQYVVEAATFGEAKKGEWSGWKVRVTYTAKSKYGCKYKAQRWYFLDKDCQTVIRHFDLPIVGTGKTEKATNQKPKSKKKGQGGVSRIVLSEIK